MTNQDTLIQTVLQAKCAIAAFSEKILNQEKSGDNIDCCVRQLTLANVWVEILEEYNCQMYETTTEDKFQCLTEAEAMVLVGKLKILIS